MRLEERRQVIEVLLCAGMEGGEPIGYVAKRLGTPELVKIANDEWFGVSPSPYRPGGQYDAGSLLRQYELDACEAAYRLIESSPTLIREFFGRGAS